MCTPDPWCEPSNTSDYPAGLPTLLPCRAASRRPTLPHRSLPCRRRQVRKLHAPIAGRRRGLLGGLVPPRDPPAWGYPGVAGAGRGDLVAAGRLSRGGGVQPRRSAGGEGPQSGGDVPPPDGRTHAHATRPPGSTLAYPAARLPTMLHRCLPCPRRRVQKLHAPIAGRRWGLPGSLARRRGPPSRGYLGWRALGAGTSSTPDGFPGVGCHQLRLSLGGTGPQYGGRAPQSEGHTHAHRPPQG